MAIFHAEPGMPPHARRSLTATRWRLIPPVGVLPPQQPPALGQVLASRGVQTPAEIDAFLSADLHALADPLLLPEMAIAVEAIQQALTTGGRIRIFGDYDADGITATALLVRALSALGGVVDWYMPHRVDDGYGLNCPALEEAHTGGVVLGITVDNGITAHAQLAYAAEIGLPMIVTDHHEPGDTLPPAVAVINPKRADSAYPYRELAGVGVAFTLLRALCAARGLPADAPMRFLDLVALGTIADVAPLTGENRLLVRHGLPMLTPGNKKIGLAALLRAVGIQEQASSGDVAFKVGPRLNAAGRVAHAAMALNLLLTNDKAEAETLSAGLCEQNAQRQEEETRTLGQALAMVEKRDLATEKFLLLTSAEWHPGIIGIVAARLLERYHRPCALIAVQDGVGKGSARARAPFHLWEALERSSSLLTRFGGHRVAAGFEVAEEMIPMLTARLLAIADETLTTEDLSPTLDIDTWIDLPDVTTPFTRQVETLAPFGMGNPTPIFAATDVTLHHFSRRGQDGAHLSLSLRMQPGGRTISAIWFRHGHLADQLTQGQQLDIAFTTELNCWQGLTTPQLVVKDVMV